MLQGHSIGYVTGEIFTHRHCLGVATIGWLPIWARPKSPIGMGIVTELLVTVSAVLAFLARPLQTSNTDAIPYLEFGDAFANFGHNASNFMSADEGIGNRSPLTARSVNIRVADSRIFDVEKYFTRSGFTNINHHGVILRSRIITGIGTDLRHPRLLCLSSQR